MHAQCLLRLLLPDVMLQLHCERNHSRGVCVCLCRCVRVFTSSAAGLGLSVACRTIYIYIQMYATVAIFHLENAFFIFFTQASTRDSRTLAFLSTVISQVRAQSSNTLMLTWFVHSNLRDVDVLRDFELLWLLPVLHEWWRHRVESLRASFAITRPTHMLVASRQNRIQPMTKTDHDWLHGPGTNHHRNNSETNLSNTLPAHEHRSNLSTDNCRLKHQHRVRFDTKTHATNTRELLVPQTTANLSVKGCMPGCSMCLPAISIVGRSLRVGVVECMWRLRAKVTNRLGAIFGPRG